MIVPVAFSDHVPDIEYFPFESVTPLAEFRKPVLDSERIKETEASGTG
jgi:hypothetical protein